MFPLVLFSHTQVNRNIYLTAGCFGRLLFNKIISGSVLKDCQSWWKYIKPNPMCNVRKMKIVKKKGVCGRGSWMLFNNSVKSSLLLIHYNFTWTKVPEENAPESYLATGPGLPYWPSYTQWQLSASCNISLASVVQVLYSNSHWK